MFLFLQCVGEAVVAKGLRGLMGIVPLGQQIYDVGADAVERYRERRREKRIAADLEEVVQAEIADVRADAARIAQEIAGDQPEEVRSQLEGYLAQIPSVARQSLRRPEDLTGRSVPISLSLVDPIQMMSVLPQRAPKFKAGDRVPHGPSWVLEQMLGSGGFGEVWLGAHTFLDEKRAFKFCLDTEARERLLLHEGEVVKHVMQASRSVQQHEHGIVPLLDAYLEGETPWLAYEYVDGGDLAGLVRQWHSVAMDERARRAIETVKRIAKIVGELHRLPVPIIHRDLKPANVLLRRIAKGYVIRVTDFGISHVAADSTIRQATISTPSMSLGETYRGAHTPIYASPQQKLGRKADVRDDVHALGVIAYQMIVGNLMAERPAGKWKKRLAKANLSEEMLDLLESCWDDDPEERPKDAQELEELLARHSAQGRAKHPAPLSPEGRGAGGEGQGSVQSQSSGKNPSPPTPLPAGEREAGRRSSRAPKAGAVITGALGMKFAFVPKGTFWMSENDKNAQKQVEIRQDFYIGIYPVTQGEWETLMGYNPSHFSRTGRWKDKVADISEDDLKRFPVEGVSWKDAQDFIKQLNEKENASRLVYRLPSEAEWEFACRGAAASKEECSFDFYFASPTNNLSSEQANFDGNHPYGNASKGRYLKRTTKVGSYDEPNPLGLYDVHGNVWEWCEDWHEEGSLRMFRGGSWYDFGALCRAAYRYRHAASSRDDDLGFRLARNSIPAAS